jgi:small subunit ribosomal protein S9
MADEPTEHTDEQQADPAEQAPDAPNADTTTAEGVEKTPEQPVEPVADANPEAPVADGGSDEQQSAATEPVPEEPAAQEPVAHEPVPAEGTTEEPRSEQPGTEQPGSAEQQPGAPGATESAAGDADELEEEEPAPRVKPSVPGAHLEVDIVPEGVDPLAPEHPEDPYALDEDDEPRSEEDAEGGQLSEPISTAAIDLAAGARYKATGKRKTAIARVILRPGSGTYLVNGRALDEHFPRATLQRNIRQPLETVGYQDRMDVVARLHGGGISAQAGALRHGISRALLEADPNLRGELKRRGFLTRDSRAKERKKAGLKKARKRPQFSKR